MENPTGRQPNERAWPFVAPPPRGPVEPGPRPSVSVVMPYYNRAHVVREAVESALSQTYPADEIVICDDGSPDDLEAALGPLCDRVRIVRKPNGGFASAMNAAIRAARSEYVVQLDSDDLWEPERLDAVTFVAAARPDVDIVVTDAVVEYDGREVARFSEGAPFTTSDQRAAVLEGCFFAWPAVRRARVLEAGGFDESIEAVADWELSIRMVLDGAAVAMVTEPLYRWRLTAGSLLSDAVGPARDRLVFLPRLLEREDLTPEERRRVEELAAIARVSYARAHVRRGVLEGESGTRRWALRLLLTPHAGAPDRAKALAAAVSPALARRLLARRIDADPALAAFAQRVGRPPSRLEAAARSGPAG